MKRAGFHTGMPIAASGDPVRLSDRFPIELEDFLDLPWVCAPAEKPQLKILRGGRQDAEPWDFADALAEPIALLDEGWTILGVNRAWRELARSGTLFDLSRCDNYREFSRARAAAGDQDAAAAVIALGEIDAAQRSEFEHLDSGDRSCLGRIYRTRISTLGAGRRPFAVLVCYDATELLKLQRQRRRLGGQLLNAQEDERRRVARDLHDSTSQELVALQLNLMRLKRARGGTAAAALAAVAESLERVQREIRALSYVYHPPSLGGGCGLAMAIRTMSEGFGKRTGLKVNLQLDYPSLRITGTEATVYRLAQEALANIHRHAKATEVDIRLMTTERRLHLMIQDNGVGFDVKGSATTGVGIAAMRERVDELGGRLSFHCVRRGTSILASLPLPEECGSQRQA